MLSAAPSRRTRRVTVPGKTNPSRPYTSAATKTRLPSRNRRLVVVKAGTHNRRPASPTRTGAASEASGPIAMRVQQAVDALRRANVVLYAIDPRGLSTADQEARSPRAGGIGKGGNSALWRVFPHPFPLRRHFHGPPGSHRCSNTAPTAAAMAGGTTKPATAAATS